MKKWMIAVAGASMLYVGCGDDNSSSSSDEQSQSFKVSSAYELGSCNAYNDRQSVFVEDENAYYVCNNREWKILVENNFDGDENQEHSSESKSSSSEDLTASLCKNCEYGSLTDNRDGQIYRTVKIGEQWWMAENLNFDYQLDGESYGSHCYADDLENCKKYGRLYTEAACLDSAFLFERGDRGVCPKGWHLPNVSEFDQLLSYVGDYAGTHLKSIDDWENDTGGEDTYGFAALPAGVRMITYDYCRLYPNVYTYQKCKDQGIYKDSTLNFYGKNSITALWSRCDLTSCDHSMRLYIFASTTNKSGSRGYTGYVTNVGKLLEWAFSVRCIKD